jgi:2-polyprenyl-3-methyl-5-hydroxy-6-metoxy-1,4-benzoquinol methylase
MIQREKCPNCRSEKRKIIVDVSKEKDKYLDYLNLKGYLNIDYQKTKRGYFQCEYCGLVYRNPILEEKEKEILYRHFRDIEFRGENKEEYFQRIVSLPPEKSENYQRLSFLKKYISRKGDLLDVGTGAGVFLCSFKKKFIEWKVTGIEPTLGFADLAKKYGIKIIYGYLKNDTIDRKFDLITLNHVLEHVDDFKEMLALVKSYLKKEGFLYVEVPSSEDIGYLPVSHDRFMCQHDIIFSNQVLEKILKDLNYSVINSDSFISLRKKNNLRIIAKLL